MITQGLPKSQTKKQSSDDISLADTGLRVQVWNALCRNEITTIEQLINTPTDVWSGFRWIGVKARQEIMDVIDRYTKGHRFENCAHAREGWRCKKSHRPTPVFCSTCGDFESMSD